MENFGKSPGDERRDTEVVQRLHCKDKKITRTHCTSKISESQVRSKRHKCHWKILEKFLDKKGKILRLYYKALKKV